MLETFTGVVGECLQKHALDGWRNISFEAAWRG